MWMQETSCLKELHHRPFNNVWYNSLRRVSLATKKLWVLHLSVIGQCWELFLQKKKIRLVQPCFCLLNGDYPSVWGYAHGESQSGEMMKNVLKDWWGSSCINGIYLLNIDETLSDPIPHGEQMGKWELYDSPISPLRFISPCCWNWLLTRVRHRHLAQ